MPPPLKACLAEKEVTDKTLENDSPHKVAQKRKNKEQLNLEPVKSQHKSSYFEALAKTPAYLKEFDNFQAPPIPYWGWPYSNLKNLRKMFEPKASR